MAKISWKNKRCPKCGSPVDMAETCTKCGRPWTKELEKDPLGNIIEQAEGLEMGKQHESIIKVSKRKPRKPRFTRTADELAGKKFRLFSEDLPPQFAAWAIFDDDSEMEVIRKRSLMRLDSRKIYNQMGLSVRAHEATKTAVLWLARLWEFLEPAEREALLPTAGRLKDVFEMLALVRRAKIAQAVKMEKALEKAYQQARSARIKAAAEKPVSKFPPPESDSEGLGLMPVGIDADELMKQAKESLLKLEKEGGKRKRGKKRKEPEEQQEAPDADIE